MPTNTPANDDQAERYSMIEMGDVVPAPAERQAIPVIRDTPTSPAADAVAATVATVAAVDRALADELTPIVSEGARNAVALAVPTRSYSYGRQLQSTRPAAPRVVAPVAVPAVLSGATLIAGAAAAGEAVLVGWSGLGEMTREAIAERLTVAGLPLSLLPAARTAHAQAGRAVADVCGRSYDVTSERRATAGAAAYAARWSISTPIHGAAIGEPASSTVGTATLMADGTLAIEGPAELVTGIQAEFQRRIAAEVFVSADVTSWLRGVVCGEFGGVKLGGVFYVPRAGAARAEALCQSMSTGWGTNWIAPALPVATSDALRRGLVHGLSDEAAEILAELAAARETARQQAAAGVRKASDIGTRAAASFMLKLRNVAERSLAYGALLGPDLVAELRATVLAALATVEPLLDPAAQRGWLIWEEIEREQAARGGGE